MAKTTRPTTPAAVVDAALDEANPEQSKTIAIVVDGVNYDIPRSRGSSIQFRRLMQQGKDALALEFLLGDTQFEAWLDSHADEDGSTSVDAFADLMEAVGREVFGVGN